MPRIIDIVLALLGLVLLSPLLLLLTLLVAVSVVGFPFFVQQRTGRHGQIFKLIKFRSMSNAVDSSGQLLPDGQRISRFGHFLRASSLDELPELYNVIKGDMALVGPRPLLPRYLPRYSQEQMQRHEVRPGITGWAQIHGRNDISWDEKFALDVWYVRNRNISLDCKILVSTVAKVVKREGISSTDHSTMEEFLGESGLDAAVDSGIETENGASKDIEIDTMIEGKSVISTSREKCQSTERVPT